MGQNQSSSCICENDEVIPANTESRQTPQEPQKDAPADETTEVIQPKINDKVLAVKIVPDEQEDEGDQHHLQNNESVEGIDLSDLDPQISKAIRNKRALSKWQKRRPFSPFRKRKEHKEFVTTSVTIRLNSNHNIVLFLPQQLSRKGKKNIDEENEKIHAIPPNSSETKLVIKQASEMRKMIVMQTKKRRDSQIDQSIVCGIQIFTTRYKKPCESAPQSRAVLPRLGGYVPRRSLRGMNVSNPSFIDDNNLQLLLAICRTKLFNKHESNANAITAAAQTEKAPTTKPAVYGPGKVYDLSPASPGSNNYSSKLSQMLSTIVPAGIGRELFTPERILNTKIGPGLSSEQCDFIVDTSERCSRGNYAAYTYAKQTLGCRDFDDLATLCEWPVLKTYSSIIHHIEKKAQPNGVFNRRVLVLDEREPHVVKYDTSKKERMKLDMHTDKSEWTFIIALSDGKGADYYGGGTYLECMDATVHLQKGHALIFPGKRRHRGQKIIDGIRFLLVGFLVQKEDLDAKRELQLKNNADVAMHAIAINDTF